uniref:Glutaredoxin domain-containing protein n=1 Tax=viral metagenome TaxID=1070528 RepID=A0A6C0EHP0_9ZZZZ
MSKPVLFYSPSCSHCINLWKNLKELNILDKIIKINSNKTKVPNYIKSVPTLIVEGRDPIKGESILMYFKSAEPPKVSLNNSSNNSGNNSLNVSNEGVEDYMAGEMGGSWSDNYSFIENKNPIKHSYSFIDSVDRPITTTNTIDNNGTNSNGNGGNNTSINQRLDEYKANRDKDFK